MSVLLEDSNRKASTFVRMNHNYRHDIAYHCSIVKDNQYNLAVVVAVVVMARTDQSYSRFLDHYL